MRHPDELEVLATILARVPDATPRQRAAVRERVLRAAAADDRDRDAALEAVREVVWP